jgi:hypothetical protein
MIPDDPEQRLPPWRWGPRNWFALAGLVLVALYFLRVAPALASSESMKTLPPPAKKPAARRAASKSAPLRAVDENGRFILGYAKGLVRVRPGVDLTKPTLAPGYSFA